MKLAKRASAAIQEGDFTPMIDMVFQLIAFFMVLINFNDADTNEKITLPNSELAKPPDGPMASPITIHVTKTGNAIIGGEEVPVKEVKRFLARETAALELNGKSPKDATVIIRGDQFARTGRVQELIKECQLAQYSNFVLRAKEDTGN